MLKLKGFSSLSLVVKLISPVLVPVVDVSIDKVIVSDPPAAMLLAKPFVTVNPLGTLRLESDSVAVPSLKTTKL